MALRVTFLGTSGSMPTLKRSLPSIVLRYSADLLMFDCGEGTQRQMVSARLGFPRKMKIFVTHMHGDHVLGLPGLIQSMALLGRENRLDIYGPRGIRDFLECVRETLEFGLNFPLEVHEIRSGENINESYYQVRTASADHVVPALCYAFVEKPRPGRFKVSVAKRLKIPEGPLRKKLQSGCSIIVSGRRIMPQEVIGPSRPGLKITYTGDTRPSKAVTTLAQGSDLLIHDACFDSSLEDKAELDGHSTAAQAAQVARKARVRQLALTHISARYRDQKILLTEARKVFRSSFVAEDLMTVEF